MKKSTGKPLSTNIDYILIPLTRGLKTAISLEDEEWAKRYHWYALLQNHNFRAARGGGNTTYILLHRQIANAPLNLQVDHINGNTLDNRRCNLRLVTQVEQNRNQKLRETSPTQLIGVHYRKDCGVRPYVAQITVASKTIFLGHFKTKVSAAKARDKAARRYFGNFTQLNFPRKEEELPDVPSEIANQKPTRSGDTPSFRGQKGKRFSEFVGVFPYGTGGKFGCCVGYKGKRFFHHGFITEREAAQDRDKIIKEMNWPHPLQF